MSTLQQLDDSLIARYTSQPTRLPAELRRQIEHAWHGAPVQLYALADLDQGLRLSEAWLALGPRHIAVAKRESDGWDVRSFERSRIEAVREAPGLSANTLTILGTPGEPALALLRYTHRQRRAFENIRFVLEEQLQGHARELADGAADRGDPAPARVPQALPPPADTGDGGRDGHHAGQLGAAVPRGLPDRPRGAAGTGGNAAARARRDDRVAGSRGDGSRVSGAPGGGPRAAAPDVHPGRVGGSRPAC